MGNKIWAGVEGGLGGLGEKRSVRMHRGAALAHRNVRDGNTAGCAGLCQAKALHHGAAEAHFQELLHMVSKGGAPCHNQPHPAPQPSLDLGKNQLVEEWGSLQYHAVVTMSNDPCCCHDESWSMLWAQ